MLDERAEAIRALVEQWMNHARSELSVAHMSDDERISPEILAFHAQQAVEKAFKAILVRDQIEFPRTHVIAILINLCRSAGYEIPEAVGDAVVLTRYAVATRYPGQQEPVSREEAREAALLASQVLDWVEQQLDAQEE